jgi:hypothetical protein
VSRHLPVEWDSISVDSVPHEAFADEAAIDFPSVHHLVERIRDAFLGEPAADALRARVRLSGRDAARGTVVSLEVPLRATCTACGGRGEIWAEPCAGCGGSGIRPLRHPVRLSMPPGVGDGARFRFRVTSPHAAPVRVDVRVAVE